VGPRVKPEDDGEVGDGMKQRWRRRVCFKPETF
jgi:hypothetical protein